METHKAEASKEIYSLSHSLPSCCVAILNYNGEGMLQEYLPSILQYSREAEIVVIDNASTDGSLAFLNGHYPTLRVIKLPVNHGYAGGYNEGLVGLTHDVFVLINSDVRVTAGWLKPLLNAFDNSNLGACQPKIRADKRPTHFEHAGAAGGFMDDLGFPYCRGRVLEDVEEDLGQHDSSIECFWATGACLAIRRSAFESLGGFDAGFFAHFEEIDLCWRMQLSLGLKVICEPSSVVYHLGGGTLAYGSSRKVYLNFRNSLLTLRKNAQSKRGLVFFLRFWIDQLAALQFLVKGRGDQWWAVQRAWRDAWATKVIRTQANHPAFPQKPFSLLWSVFIQKKKTYKDLIK